MPLQHHRPPPRATGPLDAVSTLLAEQGWAYEQEGEVIHSGAVRDGVYCPMNFTWMEPIGLIHYVCFFELEVRESAKAEIEKLISLSNQKMYVGHFEHRPEVGGITFRYGLYVNEGEDWNTSLLLLINTALHSCATYHRAFVQVVEGVPADAALRALEIEAEQEHPAWAQEIKGEA